MLCIERLTFDSINNNYNLFIYNHSRVEGNIFPIQKANFLEQNVTNIDTY